MKMNSIQFVLALLIVGLMAGCPSTTIVIPTGFDHSWSHGIRHIVVDEVTYDITSAFVLKDGKSYSLVFVFPKGQHYYPVFWALDEEPEPRGYIYLQDDFDPNNVNYQRATIGIRYNTGDADRNTRLAEVAFNNVYFIDDGNIVFQKSMEEVGLLSEPKFAMQSGSLLPALERMVREHVKTQKPETEE